ncbi:MAG: C40 family peptidase, partial [Coriobacteriales bacterium]|nr:C40 family peptidase [Coriobacteriales bacterium]
MLPDTLRIESSKAEDKQANPSQRGLSRRRFLGLITTSVAAVAASSALSPLQAFAVTSAEKQAEADAAKAQLDEWEAELYQAENDYYVALEAHEAALTAMAEAQGRIELAETQIADGQAKLAARATSMYKSGPLSFLDVLFGAHSFEEFTTSWDLLNGINQENANLIAQTKIARQEAQDAHDEYTAQEKIAADRLAEAEAIRVRAEQMVAEYDALVANLEAEVAQLIEEERRAEEERQRRAAEAAAAAAAAAANRGGGGGYTDGWESIPYNGETFDSVVDAAWSRIGCWYEWGATGPNTFDCSGLIWWCYTKAGLSLTRSGVGMGEGAPIQVPAYAAEAGDILWTKSHVALSIGGGQYIEAPHSGAQVRVADNIGRFLGAGR